MRKKNCNSNCFRGTKMKRNCFLTFLEKVHNIGSTSVDVTEELMAPPEVRASYSGDQRGSRSSQMQAEPRASQVRGSQAIPRASQVPQGEARPSQAVPRPSQIPPGEARARRLYPGHRRSRAMNLDHHRLHPDRRRCHQTNLELRRPHPDLHKRHQEHLDHHRRRQPDPDRRSRQLYLKGRRFHLDYRWHRDTGLGHRELHKRDVT
jgi:hypothetical protein